MRINWQIFYKNDKLDFLYNGNFSYENKFYLLNYCLKIIYFIRWSQARIRLNIKNFTSWVGKVLGKFLGKRPLASN